jgi:hypothetical protein
MAFETGEERTQIQALKAHQKSVRVTAAAEALANAEEDHSVAVAERTTNKQALLNVLDNA